jgi:phosphoribosyl 1,2-cyclic phosphate phosphodiesterase
MDCLTFLGTGDSLGVPRVYCDCNVCTEARTTGINKRFRSSVLLETMSGRLLIDCGPDWMQQMETFEIREIDNVLITHAHHDHIAGLPELTDACRYMKKRANVYAPEDVFETIRQQYPWLENHLNYYSIDDKALHFGSWAIKPWKVNHGRNGYAYAYKFSRGDYHWAYCSDSINLQYEQKDPLFNLNLLILGTNFYKEDAETSRRSVYDMTEAVQLIEEITPERVYFTHMSHGVDITENYFLPTKILLARHGMEVKLCE